MVAVYGVRVWNTREHALGPDVDVDLDEHEHETWREEYHDDFEPEPEPEPDFEVEPETGVEQEELPEEHNESSPWDQMEKPPLFERYHLAEMALPQHHVKDPFAGGKKYLWVENHVHCECPVGEACGVISWCSSMHRGACRCGALTVLCYSSPWMG